jgi:DNA-directed RNA polymerase specialized sigma subunit
VELGYEPSKKEWAEYLRMPIGELVRKLEEAEFARDKMVMANLRLVVSVAKRYHSYGLEMADLIQEGSIGLLRGVEKFDHTRGYKLSTYVHWWIRQVIHWPNLEPYLLRNKFSHCCRVNMLGALVDEKSAYCAAEHNVFNMRLSWSI